MAVGFTEDGHLDLSHCFMKMKYDMFCVYELAKSYYFSEMCDLTAWDGTKVEGMRDMKKYHHLIGRHGANEADFNILLDTDLERVARLPIAKEAITGELPVDLYAQDKRKKTDKIEVVVEGIDKDYVVVLACVDGCYRVRSAYPAGADYVRKIKKTSRWIERLPGKIEKPRISGTEAGQVQSS